ncbi:MAG: class I poly(R)-hydroxyalkanoic acid synthase [Alphaproteobacteria bacterium]|nr:class I poly(R)-hydroxyalkanoic acid synthase [Alphaproteobacteria bacterium]
MVDVAERAQRLVLDFLTRHAPEIASPSNPDPLNVGNAFFEMTARMMADPVRVAQAQMSLWQDYLGLWQNAAARVMGLKIDPVAEPEHGDRRFKDPAWSDNQIFDFVKQSYLLTSRWLQSSVREVEGLDRRTAKKVDFYTRQFVEAMSPSNFLLTNPEVLRATMESGGENLIKGLNNLLTDMERGKGRLAIRMTDMNAFEVGRNIAVSPGKVVFRNDLIELIQYQPSTKTVQATPLLIVPPWINKFYILDLRQGNSLIKYAVDQGHTVFVVSWVNPDAKLTAKTFDDYMFEGPIAALEAIEKATGAPDANVVGYCIGGTLLACTLAYMAGKGDAALSRRIKTATFLTTMVDFDDPGELDVFIDERQLANLDESMGKRGYLEGNEMAAAFNMMRGTDLIWSFVVNNYLLGKEPFPFDLLYWNSDSTRMPAAMHAFYLRKMYHENKLSEPDGITLGNVKLDLRKIKTPAYIVATREDHIAPWKSAYRATQLYSGERRFVLAASGHIAGVVNPPAAKKYCWWENSRLPADADDWLAGSKQHEGSWWPDWDAWTKAHDKDGGEIPARVPGQGKLKVLCDAPGEYVRVRIVES